MVRDLKNASAKGVGGNALASRVFVIKQVYYLKRDSLYIQLYKDQEKNKEKFPYFSICRFCVRK